MLHPMDKKTLGRCVRLRRNTTVYVTDFTGDL